MLIALTLTSDKHPQLPYLLHSLGLAYSDRSQRLAIVDLVDLETAIEYTSRALSLTPNGHPELRHQHSQLGKSYSDKYRRLGELADLEKAVECASRALALTPDGHPDISHQLSQLGKSHSDRYQRLGEPADLEKAAECASRALALTPDGHPDMPHQLSQLGKSYNDRYQRFGEPADLEKAVECASRALALTPDGHPDISHQHSQLGKSYSDKYRRLGELADLEKAVECASRALALTPDGHPSLPTQHFHLAKSRFLQFQHTNELSHSQESLHSFRSAARSQTGEPRDKFVYALHWANLASKQSSLNPIEAFQAAIDLLPQFIWIGATTNQRYMDLYRTEGLAIQAASVAIQLSDYPLALEWLEQARCVVWNQSIMLRSPLDQLQSSHPALATRLQTVVTQLRNASSQSPMPEQIVSERRRLAKEYDNLLNQVRTHSGFEDFLQPMKASDLIRAAQNGPIVVIICGEDRCNALLILPGKDNIQHLPLPNFTKEDTRRVNTGIQTSLRHTGLRGVRVLQELLYQDSFRSGLAAVWSGIVKPVLDFLGYTNTTPTGSLPHVTWCPTGVLSFLPLHAAGDYNEPHSRVFNYVISSYTPTLTALLATTPSMLNHDSRVLAIGQATTPGYSALPGTIKELACVKTHVENKAHYSQLIGDQAVIAAVLDAMEQHDWVHFACHAYQNINDPVKSGFFLHDDILDLAAINRRSFKNKGLAYLSASNTATGDEKLPDEAIHLAAGMLMAGYSSVIATMWSPGDEDAVLVADEVYSKLMKDGQVGNGEGGEALHYAIAVLREKVGEKEFERWMPYIHIGS
ncbi:aromatic di-alanine and TPR containing protein [Rhizoctonia solani AG-3 Rhs1AP]|uniref:Aromatic di-alanine and TPR containing protein n=1 Tax=Rhizoctonia solani AG-3 Rhs1AP TaxID=1086054 RepID=X8JEG0_9AGAM|nr:aromatic di-alanine and TPR containing protein [Rhizoctonia solani AG-3 Rhs1AP]